MGYCEVASHRIRDISLFSQGNVNFIVNHDPESHAARFVADHGRCAPAMAWRVVDAKHALKRAVDHSARD